MTYRSNGQLQIKWSTFLKWVINKSADQQQALGMLFIFERWDQCQGKVNVNHISRELNWLTNLSVWSTMATSSANQAAASEVRHDSEREVGIVRSRHAARRAELTNQIPYDLTYLHKVMTKCLCASAVDTKTHVRNVSNMPNFHSVKISSSLHWCIVTPTQFY